MATTKGTVTGFAGSSDSGVIVGEFTALAAAGSLGFEGEGVRLVRKRGRSCRRRATPQGGMAAIIGLDEAATRAVCSQAGVVLANLNCRANW